MGAVLGAGALVLSACTAGTSADDEDSFSFGFPTSNNLESPYETLAVAFMESHPGVSIQLNPQPSDSYAQNIRTQLQAGNAPDVLQVTPGRGSGQGVLLLAEADFLEPLGTTASDLIPETNRELFEENGQTYAQPLDFTVQGLVTNEGAVQRVLESFPEDTGQLLADCKTAAGRGESFMAVAGVAANQAALLAVTIAAGRVYADTPEWDVQRASGSTTFAQSPGWTDTLETIVRMKDAGCLQPGAEGAGFDAITNGLSLGSSLTSAIPGGAATEIMRAAPDQEFTVHPFPADSPDTAWVYGSANYALSITAASRKKRAAQDFLDWIAEPEQAKLFSDASGALPVTGFDGMDLDGTIYGPVGGLLKEGRFSPQPSNVWPNQEVYQSLGVGVQGLLTGQTTVETVLESMDSAWR